MSLPFELHGALADDRAIDLAAYAERLAAHRWGGAGVKRMVVGDLDASLRVWMPPERYRERQQGAAHRSVATGAITFKAVDGLCTIAVPDCPDRRHFLVLATHEMGEAALDARQDAEGYVFPDGTHDGVAHVLFTEYAVERARVSVGAELGWPDATFANSSVVKQLADFEQALPGLVAWAVANDQVPVERNQYWFELIRMYAMAAGRADGGSALARQDVADFAARPGFGAELGVFWSGLDVALNAAYALPQEPTASRDAEVRENGWLPLSEVFSVIWENACDEQAAQVEPDD